MTPAYAQKDGRLTKEALELVGIVREFGPDTLTEWLSQRGDNRLRALCMTLACLVPEDRSAAELLAWCDPKGLRDEQNRLARLRKAALPQPLKECGTHAAFTRHKTNGEQPCELCVLGERLYQRERARLKRARLREAA